MDPIDEKMDFEEEELRSKTSGQEEPEMDSLSGSERGESSRNVVDFHSAQTAHESVVTSYKMKVIVIEPKTFDDAQQVANNLREKKPVVINFEKTEAEDAKRIIDFISGTTYALNGEIKKVGHNVFLCAPSNVNVTYTEEERRVSSEMPWLKK